jgi:hypothetical protein
MVEQLALLLPLLGAITALAIARPKARPIPIRLSRRNSARRSR